jgi:hypothetical protein
MTSREEIVELPSDARAGYYEVKNVGLETRK